MLVTLFEYRVPIGTSVISYVYEVLFAPLMRVTALAADRAA